MARQCRLPQCVYSLLGFCTAVIAALLPLRAWADGANEHMQMETDHDEGQETGDAKKKDIPVPARRMGSRRIPMGKGALSKKDTRRCIASSIQSGNAENLQMNFEHLAGDKQRQAQRVAAQPFGVIAVAGGSFPAVGRIASVKADGNCWWRSLATHVLGHQRWWKQVKAYVRCRVQQATSQRGSEVSRAHIRRIVRRLRHKGRWAEHEDIACSAWALQMALSVHMQEGEWSFVPQTPADRLEFILADGHFSPVISDVIAVAHVASELTLSQKGKETDVPDPLNVNFDTERYLAAKGDATASEEAGGAIQGCDSALRVPPAPRACDG